MFHWLIKFAVAIGVSFQWAVYTINSICRSVADHKAMFDILPFEGGTFFNQLSFLIKLISFVRLNINFPQQHLHDWWLHWSQHLLQSSQCVAVCNFYYVSDRKSMIKSILLHRRSLKKLSMLFRSFQVVNS